MHERSVKSESAVQRVEFSRFVEAWPQYVGASRPVVIRVPRVLDGSDWIASLSELIGDADVPVTETESGVTYGRNRAAPKPMKVSDLLEAIRHDPQRYQISGTGVQGYAALAERARMPEAMRARVGGDPFATNIWIGGHGYLAALHYDAFENLNLQATGEKRFRLFPPFVREIRPQPIWSFAGHMAQTSSVLALEEESRRLALQQGVEVVLQAGEMLYIPFCWWHQVESIGELNVNINYWWLPGLSKMLRHPRQMVNGGVVLAYRKLQRRPLT